ncbi:MAG TPA: HAD-IA family hydrolase [Polyangiaceae bacterium]|nr:HAD-IA family hydrolase [Polyangiaceae bacterium]
MSQPSRDPGGPARLGIPIRLGVVFDLDGTLIDSRLDIASSANHALRAHGFAELSVSELSTYVGDGARWLLARAARLDHDSPSLDPLLATFVEYYAEHPTEHTLLLPGAREVLTDLAHLPLALCTNKPRPITDRVLENLRLHGAFSVVVGGGDLPKNKPDPLPLQHIAERLGLTPPELVMVGDGAQDINCAKAAGAHSVGVEGGMQGSELLLASGPDVLLESLFGLPAALAPWLNPSASDKPR